MRAGDCHDLLAAECPAGLWEFPCRLIILSVWQGEKNRIGNDFLIIVNEGVIMAAARDANSSEGSTALQPQAPSQPRTPAERPTEAQLRYLERGLKEPGGKLPLFDRDGRAIPRKTVEACIAHGWAEPWVPNPVKPDWLVCRLTAAGFRALGRMPG